MSNDRDRRLLSGAMFPLFLVSVLLVTGSQLLVGVSQVSAYPRYYDPNDPGESGYCKSCHPDFNGRGPLHDVHVGNNGFTSTCDFCHVVQNGDNPLTSEVGDPDGPYYGCAGCHGRDYGKRSDTGELVMEAYGLRRRHVEQNDVPICATCHDLSVEPLPETVLPAHYTTGFTSLTSSCDSTIEDNSTRVGDPDSLGLDNDGDGLYDDPADPDCGRGSPSRIVNVRWSDLSTLQWTPLPAADADGYQVLKGELNHLHDDGDFVRASCADSALIGNQFTDDPTPPALADGFYYLVRSTSGGSRGTYESDSLEQSGERDLTASSCS
jgi:hypothetical protein